MKVHKCYKIVNVDENGELKTLYHGCNGSKKLEMGKWLESETKVVSDGSKGTKFVSGWHSLRTYEECIDYLKLFKHKSNKRIAECRAKRIWPKKHSRHNVLLSKHLLIERVL